MSQTVDPDPASPRRPHEPVSRRIALGASDEDRDQTADRLRHAAAEGRLTGEEFEQRLDAVFSARTYGQLDATVSDLPSPRAVTSERLLALARLRPVLAVAATLTIALLLLLAAGVTLRGHASGTAPNQPLRSAVAGQPPHRPGSSKPVSRTTRPRLPVSERSGHRGYVTP
jgi:hypothetical protein